MMLVWVVLNEVIRFSEEGVVLDKLVGAASVHKSFEDALEFAESQNRKLIEKNGKVVTMPNGEIIRCDFYVDKNPVYMN